MAPDCKPQISPRAGQPPSPGPPSTAQGALVFSAAQHSSPDTFSPKAPGLGIPRSKKERTVCPPVKSVMLKKRQWGLGMGSGQSPVTGGILGRGRDAGTKQGQRIRRGKKQRREVCSAHFTPRRLTPLPLVKSRSGPPQTPQQTHTPGEEVGRASCRASSVGHRGPQASASHLAAVAGSELAIFSDDPTDSLLLCPRQVTDYPGCSLLGRGAQRYSFLWPNPQTRCCPLIARLRACWAARPKRLTGEEGSQRLHRSGL